MTPIEAKQLAAALKTLLVILSNATKRGDDTVVIDYEAAHIEGRLRRAGYGTDGEPIKPK